MLGYDSAQRLKKDDDLGRWRFAAEIVQVIRSTPAEWSARIGIFGKWGEGKSTVLHFMEEMLKGHGDIVVNFNPWAIRDLDELWEQFGISLSEALEVEDLAFESPWKGVVRKLQDKLGSTALPQVAQGTAEFFGKDKAYNSALGLIGKWLRRDGAQVASIREQLGSRRVIVFIDDLDRATPDLLPKLLLSLREILDLPRFTFVLAFDNEIVSSGLVGANEGWSDGDNFLDKILDFQYNLPPSSKAGRRLLLNKMLDSYADFVPRDSIASVEHLLPENPRKLKKLIRGIVSLRPQVARHDGNELNWVEIWLAEMIRQESHEFFVRLLDGGALDSLIGASYFVRRMRIGDGESDQTKPNADIEKVLKDVGVLNKVQQNRLIDLVIATRRVAGIHVSYNFKFAFRPEAITWKEFHELLVGWKKNSHPETISAWIIEHSAANSVDPADIQTEIFDTLLSAIDNAAFDAAHASTVEGNASHCAEANALLTLTKQFLNLPQMLTPERFGKVYQKALYWIAFRTNEVDRALRESEREMLLELIDRACDDQAPRMLETIKPWESWAFPHNDGKITELMVTIQRECVARLLPKVERAFVIYLDRPESLRFLLTPEGSPAFRYILASKARLPWGTIVRKAVLNMVQAAEADANSFEKANELLKLLHDAFGNSPQYLSLESSKAIVSNRDFTAALWKGATSRRFQSRMLNVYLAMRDSLIGLGANEEDLPLDPELARAKEASLLGVSMPNDSDG
jgi:KAP family P-loop domain